MPESNGILVGVNHCDFEHMGTQPPPCHLPAESDTVVDESHSSSDAGSHLSNNDDCPSEEHGIQSPASTNSPSASSSSCRSSVADVEVKAQNDHVPTCNGDLPHKDVTLQLSCDDTAMSTPASVKDNTESSDVRWKMPKNTRWLFNQVLLAVAVSTGSLIVGFSSAFTSPALESMKHHDSPLKITESQASWVSSLMPLSAIPGALLSGWLLDRWGRRLCVMATAALFLASFLLIGVARSVYVLFVARAAAGLAIGTLSPAIPVYLGETVHAKIRGTLGMFPTTIGNSGIMLCFLLGAYLRWDHLALAATVLPVVFAALMLFVPESPHWYLSKGRFTEATKSMQWLRGNRDGERTDTTEDAEAELANVMSNLRQAGRVRASWSAVLSRQYRRPLLISCTLMFFQQLSGINAVIFYASTVLKNTNESIDSNLSSVIIGSVNVLSSLLANLIIDKVGRRVLLYVSSMLVALNLFVLSIYMYVQQLTEVDRSIMDSLSWLPQLCLVLFVLSFTLGWGPIPWLFLGEGLPSHMRGKIGSLASTFNWACTFLVTKTFTDLNRLLGYHGTFWIFGSCMVVAGFIVYLVVPETRGRTLVDIERSMRRKGAKLPINNGQQC